MVRKLDKIEKEMGYCEIKLEKERRLRRQVEFLRADLEVLDRFVKLAGGDSLSIARLPFKKIALQVTKEKQASDRPGPCFQRAREDFIVGGVLEQVRQERDILTQEKEDIEAKFNSFHGFGKKRDVLKEEKREALSRVDPSHTGRMRKLNESFQKTEQLWNSLTEDSLNVDEGIFCLTRAVDYLKSSRSFLIAAKGSFDIECWVESDYAGNLFRHTNLGRAKEMIEGENRNLKLSQKELVCVVNVKFDLERFEPVLPTFLGALFDDIFLDGRLERTINTVESAIQQSEKLLKQVRTRRTQLHRKLERAETTRVSLFQRLGEEHKGRVSASSSSSS